MGELDRIFESDAPDVDKLALAFEQIVNRHIERGQQELELLRAEQDRDALVKEHVKLETLRYARRVLGDCYRRVTGRKAWDE